MFGLSAIFAAFRRLAAAVNRTADMWEAANDQLAGRLALDGDEADRPLLPAPDAAAGKDGEAEAVGVGNGRRKAKG